MVVRIPAPPCSTALKTEDPDMAKNRKKNSQVDETNELVLGSAEEANTEVSGDDGLVPAPELFMDVIADGAYDGTPIDLPTVIPSGSDLPPDDLPPAFAPPPFEPRKMSFDDYIPPSGSPSPKGNSVLMGILERSKSEAENETARLMESIRERSEVDRRRKEDEEQQKANSARARVDEERRKREAAIREYEERKRRKEQEERSREDMRRVAEEVVKEVQEEKKSSVPMFVVIALVVVGLAGGAGFFLFPRAAPIEFVLDRPLEMAKTGANIRTPIAFGPATVEESGQVVDSATVVAKITPATYSAPAPAPRVVRGPSQPATPKKVLSITTGIIGGKRVTK